MKTESPASRRVLLVAPQPFFHAAGTPLNIRAICRVLTEDGYEVRLLTLPMGSDVAMPGLIYHRTLRLPFVSRVPVGFSLGKAAYNVILLGHLLVLLLRMRFSAVHAFEEAALYACPIGRAFGASGVMDLDSDLAAQLRGSRLPIARSLAPLVRPLLRFALRRSACAITVAEHLSELVKSLSPETPVAEIRDIPPEETLREPVAGAMDALRRTHALGSGPLVVYTGNFDVRQGVEMLIRAAPEVIAKRPESRFVLVGGEGHEIARLKELTASLGVAEAVYFAGKCPSETMPEWMGLASVLVSPRLEPLVTPLKVYAYMASGRPIVATDLPTHTQVLDNQSAILVKPDSQGLASGIVRALEDTQWALGLGARAKQTVAEKHSYESFRDEVLNAYASIASDTKPSNA